jgi:hypothetical protein
MNRDTIIGAWRSDTVAVVYSSMTMPSNVDISSLNGANGFIMRANSSLSSGRITEPQYLSGLGYAIAAGDVRCIYVCMYVCLCVCIGYAIAAGNVRRVYVCMYACVYV